VKKFFALIVLFSICHYTSSAQNNEAKWFESVFQSHNQVNAEGEIEKKENERLIALQNNDLKKVVRTLLELGSIHLNRTKNREAAMGFFIQSLALEDSLHLDREKIFTLLAIARVFEEVEDYSRSTEYIQQAMILSNAEKDLNILILVLKEDGRIQTERGDLEIAIEKYQQMLDYSENLELKDQQASALFNLGKLFMLKKDYKKALDFHIKALKIRRELKDKVSEALSLNEFGNIYLLMDNKDRAMANQLAVLDIRKELKDTSGIASTYNCIAEININNKEYDRAIANLILGLTAARETQQQEEIRKSYDYLSISYKQLGNFKMALNYRELYAAIDDFIRNEKGSTQLSDARNSYMLFQKEKTINKLEAGRKESDQVIQAQNKLRNILYMLTGLGVIIAALVTYLYLVKRRLAKSLGEINDAKDKLFSIIGHDLKGPLNSLLAFSSLLTHHGESVTKEEIIMLSKDIDKSLKNLFALLENLLQWARTQSGDIDFKKEEFDMTMLLDENKQLLSGQASNKKIIFVSNYKIPLMAKGNINSINTVLRNLISNAIKFTPVNGKITLNAEFEKNNVLVSITDTGVGMDEQTIQKLFKLGIKHSTLGTSKEKGTGLGLILCKEFIEKNGGTIGVRSKSGEGSVFHFTLPLR